MRVWHGGSDRACRAGIEREKIKKTSTPSLSFTIITTMATTTRSILLRLALLVSLVTAFQPHVNDRHYGVFKRPSALAATSSTVSPNDMKQSLSELTAGTDRGRSTSKKLEAEIESSLQNLESTCTLKAPANSPLVEGSWIVDYTTAPPPSNGQLGPFPGIARQVVSLQDGTYRNLLSVPPNDWLTASLDATWKEWDGTYLDDKSPEKDDTPNVGGSCWLVTFESLTIRLFNIPLFTQTFDNVQRIWRTTYVDDKTRIVRAGRTGRQDDEMTFYMTREE